MNWPIFWEAAAWTFWGTVIMVGGTLLILKAWDALRAWAYNVRNIANKSKCDCPSCSPELWGEMPAVVVISRRELVTPDRPAPDPWIGMVKDDIEEIILDLDEEASRGH